MTYYCVCCYLLPQKWDTNTGSPVYPEDCEVCQNQSLRVITGSNSRAGIGSDVGRMQEPKWLLSPTAAASTGVIVSVIQGPDTQEEFIAE